jgi:hypothetical protein
MSSLVLSVQSVSPVLSLPPTQPHGSGVEASIIEQTAPPAAFRPPARRSQEH